MENCCIIKTDFTDIFDQFNLSLLNNSKKYK